MSGYVISHNVVLSGLCCLTRYHWNMSKTTKVTRQKTKCLFSFICPMAVAGCNCVFWLRVPNFFTESHKLICQMASKSIVRLQQGAQSSLYQELKMDATVTQTRFLLKPYGIQMDAIRLDAIWQISLSKNLEPAAKTRSCNLLLPLGEQKWITISSLV